MPADSSYSDTVHAHLAEVEKHNAAALDTVAEVFLTSIQADGLIVTAGAGHSLAAVAESFYRAGGLACVRPLYHPDLLPMHGAKASSVAERRPGLAADVLAEAPVTPPDVLVVFSTSGVNPYPVELAAAARAAGSPVVGITSPQASAAAPRRSHSTVAEQSTNVLDTLVRPGDASYPTDAPVTAPLSSITNCFLWNALLVRLHEQATAAGIELPLWRSANTVGGDEANAGLLEHYRGRVGHLN